MPFTRWKQEDNIHIQSGLEGTRRPFKRRERPLVEEERRYLKYLLRQEDGTLSPLRQLSSLCSAELRGEAISSVLITTSRPGLSSVYTIYILELLCLFKQKESGSAHTFYNVSIILG